MISPSRLTAVALAAALTLPCTACTSDTSPQPPEQPTSTTSAADGSSPASVARRDVQVQYKFEGTSQASPAVGVVLPPNINLTPRFADGDMVSAGAALGDATPDNTLLSSLKQTAGASTVDASRLATLTSGGGPVTAPVAGRATRTATGLSIANPGLDAVADITPLQVLRYRGLQAKGRVSVETVYGQRVTPCDAVWIEAAPTTATPTATGTDQPSTPSGGRLHCRLSPTVETVAGLPLTIMLTSTPLKNVIAVPAIYVGLDKSGRNYVVSVLKDGKTTQRPVTVGASDGVVRVILKGLAPGEQITPIDGAA